MSKTGLTVLLLGAALAIAVMIAVLVYRSGKMAILEPRSLDGQLAWSGQPEARCTLLMIGDSHVARWRTPPPRGWRVARLGFPGEAAVNIAGTAPAAIREIAPDAVLIAAGTNDASAAALQGSGRDRTLDRAADAVERIILAARHGGVEDVVVAALVPPRFPELRRRLVYGERQGAMLSALSRRIVARAKAHKADVLDADALARDARGRFRPELRADALHWSPAGYEVLSEALWDRLPDCQ